MEASEYIECVIPGREQLLAAYHLAVMQNEEINRAHVAIGFTPEVYAKAIKEVVGRVEIEMKGVTFGATNQLTPKDAANLASIVAQAVAATGSHPRGQAFIDTLLSAGLRIPGFIEPRAASVGAEGAASVEAPRAASLRAPSEPHVLARRRGDFDGRRGGPG